jgi:8-oxo-dGTP diphosphatase
MRKTQLATLCYLQRSGKTLMMHRIKKKGDVHKGKWNGLGGKFKPGETPEECVIREVREESGLILKKPELRGVLMFPRFTPNTDWMVFLFVATRFSGKMKTSSREGELQWIPSRSVVRLPLWPGDRLFLTWLKKRRFFSAAFIYKRKILQRHSVVFHP